MVYIESHKIPNKINYFKSNRDGKFLLDFLLLLQPYPMKDDDCFEEFYDDIWYPVERKTHPKVAITKRNEWMIDNADLLFAYVEDGRKGGALTTLKYAEKQEIEIINLAIREK